jgi:hypothetical protein
VHGRFWGRGLPVNWIAADMRRIKEGISVRCCAIEVVQSLVAVASAHELYISSHYRYNLAKFPWLALWASRGRARRNISEGNEHGGSETTQLSA